MKKLFTRITSVFLLGVVTSSLVVFTVTPKQADARTYRSTRSYRSSYSRPSYTRIIHVRGYTKKNGTYVKPYYRTKSNKTRLDNWSHKGNTNPFTGKQGYKK